MRSAKRAKSSAVKLVIDSSVSLKWILGVEDNEHSLAQAEAILSGVTDGSLLAVQPPHWFAEVTAVITLKRPAKLDMTLDILSAFPHEVWAKPEIYRAAANLSVRLRHHLFDTLYHAVALEKGATLITADEAYLAKAYRIGNIRLLSNFSVE